MASDRPRAAKREAPSSQRSRRHHKKPKTLHNAAEFRDKRASKKKGSCERRKREVSIRTVVITEQPVLMFEPRVKNQGLSQGTVFDFLLKEEMA
ncbi:hypothetical protein J4E86_004273 [Alternaria arbusti]|uniref:uncharacterized protein n=1 Tax=Alternaria arbusti TaxID=232088 RepID=UPI0022202A84|nr:uncharacterized protein J4E86_004273 [Alternaria arbusti]KAI4958668.1 hypothetical protein J4E86_004273 [Alternaria arbusti]